MQNPTIRSPPSGLKEQIVSQIRCGDATRDARTITVLHSFWSKTFVDGSRRGFPTTGHETSSEINPELAFWVFSGRRSGGWCQGDQGRAQVAQGQRHVGVSRRWLFATDLFTAGNGFIRVLYSAVKSWNLMAVNDGGEWNMLMSLITGICFVRIYCFFCESPLQLLKLTDFYDKGSGASAPWVRNRRENRNEWFNLNTM